jgi:hypothetical protein
VQRLEKDIRKYFGFLHHILQRPLHSIGLHCFSDEDSLLDYLEHLRKTSSTTEMKKQATLASKVTSFMLNLSRHHGDKVAARVFSQSLEKLEYMGTELSGMLRREKGTKTRCVKAS